jgi:hypothetical protein
MPSDEFTELLRRIVDSNVLDTPPAPPRFLPDTLVGSFEVARGGSVYQAYFAADPEQARTQNAVPGPELQKALDAVYAVGARLLGQRSIRP